MHYKKSLNDFSMFARVDLQLSKSTIRSYRSCVKIFFETVKKPITEDSVDTSFTITAKGTLTNQPTLIC